MTISDITTRSLAFLDQAWPEGGVAVPFLGAIAARTRHQLRSVSLSRSSAVLVLQGTKVLHRGEERLEVGAGRMFMLPALSRIDVENVPDHGSGRYLALCLAFDEDMAARVAACQEPGSSSCLLDSWQVTLDEPLAVSLAHLLDMARACPGSERLLGLCLEEVLLLIAGRTRSFHLFLQASAAWGTRVAALVGADLERDWTAEDIARRLGTSDRSLRRALSSEGTGLRQVLQDVRLGAGLALLQTGRCTVTETALRCGYDSASRFSGLFKERFGLSPSEVLRASCEVRAVSG